MRVRSGGTFLGILVAALVIGAPPAFAAPPANDTPAGATPITALPFDDSVVIDEATTDALDASLNQLCGAPATEGSVWYRFDAAADGGLVFDVSGSTFSAGALVTLGDPSNGDVLTCGPGAVTFEALAGNAYFVMAFSDTPGVTTGTLVVHAEEAPPPPIVDVTVNPTGAFNPQTGIATVGGTVTCSGQGVQFSFLDVQLTQTVGRFKITGFGSTDFGCDGSSQPWTVQVSSENGRFAGGKAVSVAVAVACGQVFCGEDFEQRTVQLRGAH